MVGPVHGRSAAGHRDRGPGGDREEESPLNRSSLIQFHRVLIAAGIVFCAGFAGWSFYAAAREGRSALWVLGAVFALLAVGLGIYLWNLRRVLGYGDGGSDRR